MYSAENAPGQWFSHVKQPRSRYYLPPMSRPVSKNFNRISDFIFPDTVHVRLEQQPTCYRRAENYSLPILNRQNFNQQHDVIIVERLPAENRDHLDLLYGNDYHRPVRRRYASHYDQQQPSFNEIRPFGSANRPAVYRDRRKRHTTDNVYHYMLKSMLEEEDEPQQQQQQQQQDVRDQNLSYRLSYKTTLDPITDSESMTSIPPPTHAADASSEHWPSEAHIRVPVNGTVPFISERARPKTHAASISSRDSSSDTDITERHPTNSYHHDSLFMHSSNVPSTISTHHHHQPDLSQSIISSTADANKHQAISQADHLISLSSFTDRATNYQTNNPISSQHAPNTAHHVSLCVNDQRTTLYIDEDTLNSGNIGQPLSSNHSTRRKVHVRKSSAAIHDFDASGDYHSYNEQRKDLDYGFPSNHLWMPPSVALDENKSARPYFLIRPQSLLVLPNETAKFKCCFGGDPLPTIVWSHNESRILDLLATSESTSNRYRMHKLHDIHYLDIGPITLADDGQIKCLIMNRSGREEAVVQLYVVPSPADAVPSITQPLNDTTILEGQPLQLSCDLIGLQITVHWFHNGKLISTTAAESKSDYNDEGAVFTLARCMRNDAGTIDCFIKNRFGEARTSCRIEVLDDAEFDP